MNSRTAEHFSKVCKHAVLFILIAALTTLVVRPSYAEESVVLVAAKGSGIESISNRDIRRVFLGLKSADSEFVNKPVINLYNKDVYEGFLKNVMHMTEGAYKRKIIKRIFRNGTEKIKEIKILEELNEYLISNVGDISFVDVAAVEKMHDIEVVKVLW